MRARLQHQPACQERIDANQHKADPVNPGPGGKLVDQRVIHLRVAQLVPGDGGDARGGQLQRGPKNRREGQRQPRAARGPAHQHHAPAEEAEVGSQHQAVAHQQQRRAPMAACRRSGAWCRGPSSSCPRTTARRRDSRAGSRGAGGAARSVQCRRKKRPQQRNQPKPGKDRPPDGHRPGQRKGQLQQACGENGRGPQLPGRFQLICSAYRAEFIASGAGETSEIQAQNQRIANWQFIVSDVLGTTQAGSGQI